MLSAGHNDAHDVEQLVLWRIENGQPAQRRLHDATWRELEHGERHGPGDEGRCVDFCINAVLVMREAGPIEVRNDAGVERSYKKTYFV